MSHETGKAFEKLVEIIARLRGEDGCPWDREQTHESLKGNLLEETYEVIDAIDAGDADEFCAELGDLMMQIVLHAQLADERGQFSIKDSMENIAEKLVRRHPHVFGKAEVASAEEVLHQWEEIKAGEKDSEERASVLDGIPKALPALARAMEISKRAAKTGFEWPDLDAVVEKLDEEAGELKRELSAGDREAIAEEIGDLLFTIVNVARWAKVDPEDALRGMTKRFAARFQQIEKAARANGREVKEMTIQEMDAVWDRAKQDK